MGNSWESPEGTVKDSAQNSQVPDNRNSARHLGSVTPQQPPGTSRSCHRPLPLNSQGKPHSTELSRVFAPLSTEHTDLLSGYIRAGEAVVHTVGFHRIYQIWSRGILSLLWSKILVQMSFSRNSETAVNKITPVSTVLGASIRAELDWGVLVSAAIELIFF